MGMVEREFKGNGHYGSAKITFSKDIMALSGFTLNEKVMIDVRYGEIIIKKVKK